MDPYTLPTDFDVIVVGTGLVESIVAAAASRVGKTVLHIDNQANYGGDWASFNLENMQQLHKYAQQQNNSKQTSDSKIPCHVGTQSQIQDISIDWHIPEKETITESGDSVNWSQEKLLVKSNKFIIDLAPKLHYANGSLVQLLISSNIARYTEFRSVSRIMVYFDNKLDTIPCSRNDIFSNAHVNVIEKRLLMKFFTSIHENTEAETENMQEKTFKEFLIEKQLTPRCIHYIIHAIAMTTVDEPCVSGVAKVKRFLNSIGRFGKTPFLYCMWGSAEIPQSFCRISAVFGGVYALNQPLKEYKFDAEGNFKSLICGEQDINGQKLVTGIGSKLEHNEGEKYMSRGILLTDSSVVKSDSEHLSLILFPSEDGLDICYIIEAGSRTGTTMYGIYCVYFFMKQKHAGNPQEDLKFFVDKLYKQETSPKVLWSCYFSMPIGSDFETFGSNGFLCPGPDIDLDYDGSIDQAKAIFNAMYPEDEFLPRAPDPEEIIIGDDDEESNELEQQGEAEVQKPLENDEVNAV